MTTNENMKNKLVVYFADTGREQVGKALGKIDGHTMLIRPHGKGYNAVLVKRHEQEIVLIEAERL